MTTFDVLRLSGGVAQERSLPAPAATVEPVVVSGELREAAVSSETADIITLHRPIHFILGMTAQPGKPEFAAEAVRSAPWGQRGLLATLLHEAEPGCLTRRQRAGAHLATLAASTRPLFFRHLETNYGIVLDYRARATRHSRNR